MMTSTGVSRRSGAAVMRIRSTLPISTPERRTGAHFTRPAAFSKYARSTILWLNGLTLPLMTKIRTASVMLATRTVIPTRSCDHLTCCWLGTAPPPEDVESNIANRCRKRQQLRKMEAFRPTDDAARQRQGRIIRSAPLAQVDRATDFESVGREFESLRARQNYRVLSNTAS